MRLTVRTREIAEERPLLELLPVPDGLAFVHSEEGGEEGLVAWGEAVRVEPGPGGDRLHRLADALAETTADAEIDDPVAAPGSGLVGFASATFDASSGASVLIIPRYLVGRRDGRTWETRVSVDGDPAPVPEPAAEPPPAVATDRVRYAGSSQPDLHWLEAVAAAVARIDDDALDKVVLARDHAVWSRQPFDARTLARRLHRRFPGCFTFVVDGFLGASPELLVRRTGSDVASVTLAGTAPRSDDDEDDAALGAALLASDKDRREHAHAVTSVREVLAPRCARLDADDEPVLLRLANLQHLATRFDGELTTGETALEIADALHPTAAVGGSPREAALRTITELEGMDRGRYAGPVGWMDHRGDGELAIALRCAELAGARARLFAGAGIVAGSLPEAELEETRVKLRAMQSAFSD